MTQNFNHAKTDENKDEWLTPPELIKALGSFDLDPCAPMVRPWDMARHHYAASGLELPWIGRVWLNPPYGTETFKWLAHLAEHRRGIALIFARTETKGFHREIWNKAHAVFFFEGRLSFWHQPFKSIDPTDTEKLDKTAKKYFKRPYAQLTPEQLVEWCEADASNAPSCLVSYSEDDTAIIGRANAEGKIRGRLVRL